MHYPTIITPSSASTFSANFSATHYLLTTVPSPTAGGAINRNPNPGDGFHPINTAVQLTAVPAPGYHLDSWSGAGLSGNSLTVGVTMAAPLIVTANFAADSGPDFILGTPSEQLVVPSQTLSTTETITPLNGFNSPLTLSWTNGWPQGMDATFAQNPSPITGTTIQITTSPDTPAGRYTLDLQATGGGKTRVVSFAVIVLDVKVHGDLRLIPLADGGDVFPYAALWVTGPDAPRVRNQVVFPAAAGPYSRTGQPGHFWAAGKWR